MQRKADDEAVLDHTGAPVVWIEVRYSVVATSAVTKEVLALRVVVSVCVVSKVVVTVSEFVCILRTVVALNFVRYSVKNFVVDTVVVKFRISGDCSGWT